MFYYINKELAVVLVVVDNECTAQIMYIFTCIVVLIYFTHINSRHSMNVIYSNFTHGVLVFIQMLITSVLHTVFKLLNTEYYFIR